MLLFECFNGNCGSDGWMPLHGHTKHCVGWCCTLLSIALLTLAICTPTHGETPENMRTDRLVAWCIVPFDGKQRRPAERAEMVRRLGLSRVAYDWREKHVPTFEQEILEYKRHGIEYFAFWGAHDEAFRLFKKYDLHPQIWQTLGSPSADTREDRIATAARQMLPLVERARELGCRLGLYNHGGWGGEPENLVAVCRYLREHHDAEHVGIVYNLHHGHGHISEFAELLAQMKRYLFCLNLNGMTRDGDQKGRKILPLGEGEFDVELLGAIRDSGYSGPIGIIGHTQDDVELRLRDNLDGLNWLLPQIDGKPAGPRPKLRTWNAERPGDGPAKPGAGVLLEGNAAFRQPPLTVVCQATLPDARGYNILVANDAKRSGTHWELFSMNGTGMLTTYLPGMSPDHVHSKTMICDGRPHTLAMVYEPRRVRLFVDGELVADQQVESRGRPSVPGGLGIGRLVEGDLICRGSINRIRLYKGVLEAGEQPQENQSGEDELLLDWRSDSSQAADVDAATSTAQSSPARDARSTSGEYSAEIVARVLEDASANGDAHRGLLVFSSAKSACLSCHRIGTNGGKVGPALTEVAKQLKPDEIVESIFWPKRKIKPEFVAHMIVDADGRSHQGYIVKRNERQLVLRDPTREASEPQLRIPLDEIEFEREVGTLMPENLTAAMTEQQLSDLVRFLLSLGSGDGLDAGEMELLLRHAQVHQHGPAEFPIDRQPLNPNDWPSWQAHVNRDRLYDFYQKQADYFRQKPLAVSLLAEFPGLDGGELGHWGNQNEDVWASDAWNDVALGSVQCGVFRGDGATVPRGVCVRLGDRGQLSACFDPDSLSYEKVWADGFVKFSSVRHGFIHGIMLDGKSVAAGRESRAIGPRPSGATDRSVPMQRRYLGFYRYGRDVVFAYQMDGVTYLDVPVVKDGRFDRIVAPSDNHPWADRLDQAPAQWPEVIETPITHGRGSPYAVDHIQLPRNNPWNIPVFCGGHAFLPDGSALVCTMHGDVWRVTDFAYPSRAARWRRFASGLNHALGIVVDKDGIFVLGRDQITRLHDLNDDGEADFYECFSNAYQTSPAGHDYICGLERDRDGNFYTASGNQGLVRISADGGDAMVLATGFRNPDGLGLLPDGTVTVPCSEGGWTPASMICAVHPKNSPTTEARDSHSLPLHFGYRGPRNGEIPELPLVYLPRGLDNSSGGQTVVSSDRWGPLAGQLLHFSFGTGSHFLVLRDEVDGQLQGALVPLVGEFRSGAHRGRFCPEDGQLYVTGMQGWGSYTVEEGCFDRVRYTGAPVQTPLGFRVHENGIAVTFSEPVERQFAEDPANHFAQCWNYRYGPGYGSPEFSTRHSGMRGHDRLAITAAHLMDDGRMLFLEIPDLQPVNQLHLRMQTASSEFRDLFVTVHKLDGPRTDLPGYRPTRKTILPHPILADLAMATRSVPNPFLGKLPKARAIEMKTGSNLTYQTRSFRVRPGEPIELTLKNPDVVPHNWALAKPGTLERLGGSANKLISDPEAALRHYIPRSDDVLAYTNVVLPRESFTIYFKAPKQPGRYPYLCTFPGHWKVMNGEMIVVGDDGSLE